MSLFADFGRAAVGASGAKLTLRTQLTPDLEIDIASQAMAPIPPKEEPTLAEKASREIFGWLFRPEIEVSGFGAKKSLAPWGKPRLNLGAIALASMGVGVLGSAFFVYKIITAPEDIID